MILVSHFKDLNTYHRPDNKLLPISRAPFSLSPQRLENESLMKFKDRKVLPAGNNETKKEAFVQNLRALVIETNARSRQQCGDIGVQLTCYPASNLQLRIALRAPFLHQFHRRAFVRCCIERMYYTMAIDRSLELLLGNNVHGIAESLFCAPDSRKL